jgi:energy-coupling factor transporter transmembrane protein EcfT
LHPGARGLSFVLFTAAIFVADEWWLLLVFSGVLLAAVAQTKVRATIITVTLKALVPAILFLSAVRIWIVGDALDQTAVTALRLIEFGLIFQLLFVPLDARQIVTVFSSWRLPAASSVIWLSALSASHDLRLKYAQADEALRARGLVTDRLGSRIRALPMLLQTVFINSVRGAIGRVDLWHERSVVERLRSRIGPGVAATGVDWSAILVSAGALVAALIFRLQS